MRKIVIVFFLLISSFVYSQQDAMYSQYMFNITSVNPAYVGNRGLPSATALIRNQWVGIDGAPTSQTISLDLPAFDKKVGFGIMAYNDKVGIINNTGIYGIYSYKIRFVKSTLSFGLQGGVVQYSADYTKVQLVSPNDKAFQNNIIMYTPNVGTGIYFNNDKYYIGASIPNLYKSSKVNRYSHLFIMSGFVFPINDDIKVKPSILTKVVYGSPIQLDLNSNIWFYDKFSVGVSYRTKDAIVSIFELQLSDNLRFGYAFDYTLTDLQKYSSGSHELMLRYEFMFSKDKILTPRYF